MSTVSNKNYTRKTGESSLFVGPVRVSYAHLFSKRRNPDGTEGKYSVCLMIPKTNTAAVKALKDCEAAAKEVGKSKKWDGAIPKNLSSVIHDGDEEKDDPAFEGFMYLNVSSNNPPQVYIRENGETVDAIDDTEVYSGCWGIAKINFYPYSAAGHKGVAAGIDAFTKTDDDSHLGGTTTSASDFDALFD